jgi:hypothetical protein
MKLHIIILTTVLMLLLASCVEISFSVSQSQLSFLGTFAKLRKTTACCVTYVCLSVRPSAWNNNSVTDSQIFMKLIFWGYPRYVKRIHFSTKSDKNNGYFIQRPMRIYNNHLDVSFLEREMFQTKVVVETKIFMFNTFSRKSCRL